MPRSGRYILLKKHRKKIITSIIGLTLGVFLTWLVFRGTDWPAVFVTIQHAHAGWLTMSGVLVLFGFFAQGSRLTLIYRHTQRVHLRHVLSATQIGTFARQVLPGRGGEIIRAFLLSRFTKLPFSKCFGISVVDRLPEALVFFMILGVTIYAVPASRTIEVAADVFQTAEPIHFSAATIQSTAIGIAIWIGIWFAMLVTLYLRRDTFPTQVAKFVGKVSKRAPEKVEAGLKHFADGMHVVHHKQDMALHFVMVLMTFGFYLSALVCNFYAFGVVWDWYAPFLAMSLIAFANILPGMPGLVGQYHLAIVITLVAAAPGMSGAEMKAVALVSHAMQFGLLSLTAITFLLLDHVSLVGLEELEREELLEAEEGEEPRMNTN